MDSIRDLASGEVMAANKVFAMKISNQFSDVNRGIVYRTATSTSFSESKILAGEITFSVNGILSP